MKWKLLFYSRFLMISFILLGYASVVLSQTNEKEAEMQYERLKLAQEYANMMNTKLNDAIKKSKNFKEMKANWDLIAKSEPSKVENKVKEFYFKYRAQISLAKDAANYDETAIASKLSDFLKGTDYSVITGSGAFLLIKYLNSGGTLDNIKKLPECIHYGSENLNLVGYTGPPSMGILFSNAAIGTDAFDLDISGTDVSGNKIIVDITVSNGRYGMGHGKLLNVVVPENWPCADLNITCQLEVKQDVFGLFMVGPESESIARVKVKRIGLPGNFMQDGEIHTWRRAYMFGSIGQKSFTSGIIEENGFTTLDLNRTIRVRAGDELEVLFEAASHVISDIGISARALASVKRIKVEMCKCE